MLRRASLRPPMFGTSPGTCMGTCMGFFYHLLCNRDEKSHYERLSHAYLSRQMRRPINHRGTGSIHACGRAGGIGCGGRGVPSTALAQHSGQSMCALRPHNWTTRRTRMRFCLHVSRGRRWGSWVKRRPRISWTGGGGGSRTGSILGYLGGFLRRGHGGCYRCFWCGSWR